MGYDNVEKNSYHRHRDERMQINLIQRLSRGLLHSCRFRDRCTFIPKDSRIDTAVETFHTSVGVSADPVVVDGLVGVELCWSLEFGVCSLWFGVVVSS